MTTTPKSLRTCKNGHQYYKSSECPVCPVCEKERKPSADFLMIVAAPARRALESKGITTLEKLKKCSEAELAALHGMGPNAMGKLRTFLKDNGADFKQD